MMVRGGEFSTGTMGNFQPELTILSRDNVQALPLGMSDGRSGL